MPVVLDIGEPRLGQALTPADEAWRVLLGEGISWCGGERLIVLNACSSSLDVAWYLRARGEFDPWDAVLCGSQWAGRGQLRRSWSSPLGNLYAAVCLPSLPPAWRALASLVVGYGVRHGLGCAAVRLKWPNDLVLEDRKVGGILIEERDATLVAGIGVNLAVAPERLRQDAALPAGILSVPGCSLVAFWTQLVRGLRLCYESIPAAWEPATWCHYLASLLAWQGQWVEVKDYRFSVYGILRGVAEDGAVLLQGPEGEVIRAESGSLRPLSVHSEYMRRPPHGANFR